MLLYVSYNYNPNTLKIFFLHPFHVCVQVSYHMFRVLYLAYYVSCHKVIMCYVHCFILSKTFQVYCFIFHVVIIQIPLSFSSPFMSTFKFHVTHLEFHIECSLFHVTMYPSFIFSITYLVKYFRLIVLCFM